MPNRFKLGLNEDEVPIYLYLRVLVCLSQLHQLHLSKRPCTLKVNQYMQLGFEGQRVSETVIA